MKQYSIAAILWEDHFWASRTELPKDPDAEINLTLSIGLIMDETDKVLVLVHDIERYNDRDDTTFTVILKPTIKGRQEYGTIEIEEPRRV
jgi:hypothetical protein